jgi:hypothetical protein
VSVTTLGQGFLVNVGLNFLYQLDLLAAGIKCYSERVFGAEESLKNLHRVTIELVALDASIGTLVTVLECHLTEPIVHFSQVL